MSATPSGIEVEELPDADIVRILMDQHEEIRDLCGAMSVAMSSDQKGIVFDELRTLIAVHEAAEEAVVRPRTMITAGEGVVDDRNAEERTLTETLSELESCVIDSEEFDQKFADFAHSMEEHVKAEESEEFGRLVDTCDIHERTRLGAMFLQAERLVPQHAHPALAGSPTKQRLVAPFAMLLDRAKDAFSRVTD